MHGADFVVYGVAALVGLAVLGMVVLVAVTSAREARRQRDALTAVARTRLGGAKVDARGGNVTGPVGDLQLAVHYRSVAAGKSSRPVTQIEVTTARVPLQLDIRPTLPGHARDVREGMLIDVVIGEAAFDDHFLVQAAPADVVRALLNSELRAAMLACPALVLMTVAPGDFIITVSGRPPEAELGKLVNLAVLLGQRVATAYDDADKAALADRGGPFRDEPDASALPALRKAREADLARLTDIDNRRHQRDMRNALLIVGGLALILAACILIGKLTSRH